MKWFKDFEDEIAQVFMASQRVVENFPPPLNHKGLTYLSKFDVRREESAKNYICYLLPFWLHDISQLKKDDYITLSVGNVFAMLYFFIQDDIMDSNSSLDRDQIPLANLLQMHFLETYRAYFPSTSPFWTYYQQYILEWSDSVTNENQQDYFHTDLGMMANKAAPLKLSSTGTLLLSGQPNLVSPISDMINHVLITLQMADDWVDWEEDYIENNYNGLISMIKAENHTGSPITTEYIKNAIFVHGVMKRYSGISISNHTYIQQLDLNLPYLLSFHETLVNDMIRDAELIEEEKILQLNGGLNYWLAKNYK